MKGIFALILLCVSGLSASAQIQLGTNLVTSSMWAGTSAPGNTIGNNGDFYLLYSGSYVVTCIYGPKVSGAWPGTCVAIPTVGTWGTLNYPTWTSGTPFVKMTAAGTFGLDTTIPNTVPAAGQDLVGNAGGTAYAPVTMSGDCTRSSTGAITCTKTNGTSFGTGAFATIANYAPLASTPQNVYNTTYTATMSASTGTLTTLTLAASSGSVQKYRVSVSASESAAGTGTCTTPGTIALTLAYTDADSGYSVSSGNTLQMTWAGLTISNTLAATASINANSVWRGLPFDIKVASGSAVTLTISQQTGSNCTTPPVMKITPYVLSMP